MSNELFQVKPVTQYEEARYPSASEDDELPEERTHPLVLLVAMIFVVGISLGLIGCYLRTDYVPPETPQPDGGQDGDPPDGDPPQPDGDPPQPACEDEAIRCVDDWNLERCEDGAWDELNCGDYCRENYGPEYSSWSGCDASAEDPCDCQYDIIEGDAPWCDPNQLICFDEETLGECNVTTMEYDQVNCEERCNELHGIDAYSEGCDPLAEDPCQCVTDILDGFWSECTPEDIYCVDSETIQLCDEHNEYVHRSCDEVCVEAHGPGASSEGCDMEADDLCQCIVIDSGSGGE